MSALGTEIPFLVRLGTYIAGLSAFSAAAMLMISLFGASSYSLEGAAVSKGEFVRATAPGLVVIGGWSALCAWALWRERPWGREVAAWGMVAMLVAPAAYEVFTRGTGGEAVLLIAIVGAISLAIIWYFYGKSNVREYYRRLDSYAPITAQGARRWTSNG